MPGLGYKQLELLERTQQHGKLVLNPRIINICGNKSEAKRVIKTLESRRLIERIGFGKWELTSKGELALEE